MPLPKAPAKPASQLDLTQAVLAKSALKSKKTAKPRTEKPTPAQSPTLIEPAAVIAPSQATSPSAPTRSASKRSTRQGVRTQFVLDTNVLLHDPTSLFRFQEHDIFLPMITLEELDGHKKGTSEVARNARQASRFLDALLATVSHLPLDQGVPLANTGQKEARGNLYLQTQRLQASAAFELPQSKADNQILTVVKALQERERSNPIVLVSKDINMRIKARALGLNAEDYFNDQVIEEDDLMYSGVTVLTDSFWSTHCQQIESWQVNGQVFYRLHKQPDLPALARNQFVTVLSTPPLYTQVDELTDATVTLKTVREFSHAKNAVWGINARNPEQAYALSLLTDPDVDLVTLLGQAGTGKTLLALAAGISQVLEKKRYHEIIVTRATVPLGDDIGFLPGTEEEKMQPWMGALEDNLEVLHQELNQGGEWGRHAALDLIRSKIKIKSMNFMRGRTFMQRYVIIDEAQNLTPKQMKALITRAGPGTKLVCLGNIAQIDTPYLTEASSGLTYLVDRFRNWPHSGHITLARGERSRLADFAAGTL